MSPRGKAVLAFAVIAALAGLELWRLSGPAVAPADAPPAEFSATRAIATLHQVLVDEPHPTGSPAHAVVRDRIVAHLRALDYQVDVQHSFACNAAAVCGNTDNLIATLPGAPGGKQVVVTAHYDSVPAGPGASDDGTGVATVLEIARAVRREHFANPVVFLIDDAEEGGLLGAEGFLADARRSRDAALFINVEARGTSGPSFLFETSRDNRWLIPIVARALPHPASTSLFATIYDLLPNDTDLTIYKRAGRAGINFAYLGDGTQYHTPLDNFANVDAASVQWRGEQVLAMVRAFGNARLDAAPGDAVWFDVFASFIVWWPTGWSFGLAGLALVGLAAAIVRGRRRGELTLPGVLLGIATFVASVALAAAAGAALAWLLRLRTPGALFEPHPGAMIAAAWVVGLTAAIAIATLARRRVTFDALFAGHAVAWNALGIALAAVLPGAAYVAIVPGVVMAGAALLRAWRRASEQVACLAALVAAATVLFPFTLAGYDSLGGDSVAATAILLALVGTTIAPMLTARDVVPLGVAATIVLGVIAALVPTTAPTHPHHQSLAHVTDAETGTARWQTTAPLPLVRATAAFRTAAVAPWYGARGHSDVAPAPAIAIAPPTVTVATELRDGKQVITLDVASPRQAARLSVLWRSTAEVESLRINGVVPPPRPRRFRSALAPDWHRIVVRGTSARIEIVTRRPASAEAMIVETSFGLPAIAAPLAAARDASGAVPVHDGDTTIVERRVTW